MLTSYLNDKLNCFLLTQVRFLFYFTFPTVPLSLFNVMPLPRTQVGQLQILRRLVAYELGYSCKLDSKALFSALDTLNKYFQTAPLPDTPVHGVHVLVWLLFLFLTR